MNIGLGITTFNRPKHKELCYSSALKTSDNIQIYIAEDTSNDRQGIAKRKNECLRNLKENNFIFLVDDDIVFLKSGWAEFFIDAHKASRQHHFMYLKETLTIKQIGHQFFSFKDDSIPLGRDIITGNNNVLFRAGGYSIRQYNNCAGCFMFITKEVLEKAGGYGEYGFYGYEHAGYSERIHMAGLTPLGNYLCPTGVDEFIYAMDYCFDKPFNKQVNHEPSLKNELHKVESYIKEGFECFQKDIQQIYRPLS